ncbi:hypothetical protein [Actinocorallia longicatena]|uniref:Uncharacterized protein n=1 Tax=Actinocorallia longicatena TaxID=111803 RepID=A0ABP6QKV3_9ACTN
MTDLAWAESPLQLLSAVEARHAGLLGPAEILVRAGSDALTATAAELVRLGPPAGTTLEFASRARAGRRVWAVGDAFSGQVQAKLLTSLPSRIVLVDDGLATIHLLGLLAGPWRQPLIRARARAGRVRRILGSAAGARLRSAAREGRVTVFTGLPVPSAVLARAHRAGIEVVQHDFPYLRSLAADPAPAERTVVLGTSLVANGLVDRGSFLGWINGILAGERVAYYPHRREDPEILAMLRDDPRVTLVERGLPVELSLRGLSPRHRVLSLPSTALTSLRVLLGPDGPAIEGVTVPSAWWTDRADQSLRTHLSLFTLGPELV